jgi:glycerol-3-phosphate dehydrogenase (NAD(P)+)
MQNVTVIGSGSWATALVRIFSESGLQVSWLVRDADLAAQVLSTGRNPRYLTQVELDMKNISPTARAEESFQQTDTCVFAVPSAYLQQTLDGFDPRWLAGKKVITSIKGFVPGTATLPSHFIRQKMDLTAQPMVMGGPCHAEEIAMGRRTYITLAAQPKEWADACVEAIQVKYVQTVSNGDPVGVEFAAILKNIIAIAVGIADGLNYGANFQSVLISNSMREVHDFLHAVYPQQRDLYDSAYFGDLLVTGYSDYSRNRTLGKLLGRGIRVQQALQAMEMVAEGYKASLELAQLIPATKKSFPIIQSVNRILHQHASAYQEFRLIEQQLR